MKETDKTHGDLLIAQHTVYDACGLTYTNPIIATESFEYAACTFKLGELAVVFRVAKITPTKTGQFVTVWKRELQGPTQPYDLSDAFDLFIISVRKDDQLGQFIFPKSVLLAQGVISGDNKAGKRGMRVYPPWDQTASRQAQKTQQWQLGFFLEIPLNKQMDTNLALKLLLMA